MRVGTTLLLCDASIPFVLATTAWHSRMFHLISIILHRPCKTLLHLCKTVEAMYPNVYVAAVTGENYTEDNHTNWCNFALKDLVRRGCDFITNLDDDEFYVSSITELIEAVRHSVDLSRYMQTIFYQTGHCFYQTELDTKDFNPIRSMLYRENNVEYEFKKWICPAHLFKSTTNGNHYVTTSKKIPAGIIDTLKIYHYSYRKKTLNNNRYVPLTEAAIKEKGLVYDGLLPKLFDQANIIV